MQSSPWDMTLKEFVNWANSMQAGTIKLTLKQGEVPTLALVLIRDAVPEMLEAIEIAEDALGIGN